MKIKFEKGTTDLSGAEFHKDDLLEMNIALKERAKEWKEKYGPDINVNLLMKGIIKEYSSANY